MKPPKIQPKQCAFCTTNVNRIDYKDTATLKKHLTPQSKIVGKKRTATCSKHQRQVTRAIKQARNLGLIAVTIR